MPITFDEREAHFAAATTFDSERHRKATGGTGAHVARHAVIVTNYIPPHSLPFYESFQRLVGQLTMLIATPMEGNRHWVPDWGTLRVERLKTFTLRRPWRHPQGFEETNEVHFPRNAVARLRALKPDVVIAEQLGAAAALSAVYARVVRRTPLLYWACLSEHTEQGRAAARRTLRRWLLRRPDCVAVNGRSGAAYLKGFGVPDERMELVPYCPVMGVFENVPLDRPSRQAHRLLYSGQFVPRKGIVPFLERLRAWAERHPSRRVEFSLVGDGPQAAELRAMPLPRNLRVAFLGRRGFDELATIYADHSILVQPTLADEWGMVANEAMLSGMPILGSQYSQAVWEMVEDGVHGWTFLPDSPHSMDDAIHRALAATPTQIAAMRPVVRSVAERRTPEHAADCLLRAVNKAVRFHHARC